MFIPLALGLLKRKKKEMKMIVSVCLQDDIVMCYVGGGDRLTHSGQNRSQDKNDK